MADFIKPRFWKRYGLHELVMMRFEDLPRLALKCLVEVRCFKDLIIISPLFKILITKFIILIVICQFADVEIQTNPGVQ